MEHKPGQVHVGMRPSALKAGLGLFALFASIIGGSSAQASGTASFSYSGAPYNSYCERPCPAFPASFPSWLTPPSNACCSNPDKVLEQQFRGPGQGRKALNAWYIQDFWPLIDNKIKAITNDINANIRNESAKRGSFLEGQNNVRAISSLQQGAAQASRNHAMSESLCRYATLSQSLPSSEANGNAVKIALSKQAIDRQLLIENTPGAQSTTGTEGKPGLTRGQSADKDSRWKQYTSTFCNPADFSQGSGTKGVCQTTSSEQYNSDINYVRTVDAPLTLDLSATASSKDLVNLTALSQNLYGHDLVNNIPPTTFDASKDDSANQSRKYMKLLSAVAKRAVAQNTFDSIAAMKAKGSAGNGQYLVNMMKELGIPETEAKKLVTDNPSYYAQMEVLTRSMYQSPGFYVNLMEGPVNIKRQQTAMKSFELMQQRDMYQSLKRSEMLMATLLELELSSGQGGLDKNLGQSQ